MKLKVRGSLLIILLLTIGCISGCDSSNELPDTYIEGSDHQYMRMGESFWPYFQKGEKGYYFIWNDFIYFFDEKTEKIVPLCSRVDCLHDAETQQDKRENCNAYAPKSSASGIAWCNGSLYYVFPGDYTRKKDPVLYRIHADGSGKEELYRWKDATFAINQWIVHRDALYYMTQTFSYGTEDIDTTYIAYAMPLSGNERFHSYVMYQSPAEGVDVITLGNPTAYGNHVYFVSTGNLDGWSGTDDDWMDYSYHKVLEYNILTKETGEISLPGPLPKASIATIHTFWKDKLIFDMWDPSKGYLYEDTFYIANLDGTEAEIFMPCKNGYGLDGDGKYLYLTNSFIYECGKDPDPKFYRVYDDSLNEIDNFTVDEKQKFEIPLGLPDRSYQIYYKDSGEFGIKYWDKSAVGSLNGAEITWKKIPYEGSLGVTPD